MMKEAMFWKSRTEDRVQCDLCPHHCVIRPGARGLCNVRENREGKLYSLVYGRLSAEAVDPIEKKPLYHFLPGTAAFSIATRGCNFKCLYCQNCRLSQVQAGDRFEEDQRVQPRQLVQSALALACRSIAYTYTEPTVFFEYALAAAHLAAAQGLKNVFVTNGYITPEPLRAIAPSLHAANIDLKFMDDALYRTVCGARLQPVLDAIRLYHELGIWLEVTTLVVPTYNDTDDQLRRVADFIAGLDARIPWHVSAFRPAHRLTHLPPTPPAALRRAREIGRAAGLHYVYLGNVADDESGVTHCPACRAGVIRRPALGARPVGRLDGVCPQCGRQVPGVWT